MEESLLTCIAFVIHGAVLSDHSIELLSDHGVEQFSRSTIVRRDRYPAEAMHSPCGTVNMRMSSLIASTSTSSLLHAWLDLCSGWAGSWEHGTPNALG